MRGREEEERTLVEQDGLDSVASSRVVEFGINDDAGGHGDIGIIVDVDVADTLGVTKDGNLGRLLRWREIRGRTERMRSGRMRAGQVRSGQYRSSQLRTGPVSSGQVRAGLVRSD